MFYDRSIKSAQRIRRKEMYNTHIHTVQAMSSNNAEYETYEQYGAKLAQIFVDFDRSAQWVYEWASREFGLNKETFRCTMMALKEINRDLFDSVIAIYTAKQVPAPAQDAPAVPKAVPSTTYEACEKYGATPYKCSCPDRAKRDGSYVGLDGRPACKHMIFKQKYYTDIAI